MCFQFDDLIMFLVTDFDDFKMSFFNRVMKTVLCVWLETYPDDFYDPPSHSVLRSLQTFGEKQKQDCEFLQKTSRMLKEFAKRDDSTEGATHGNRSTMTYCFSSMEMGIY